MTNRKFNFITFSCFLCTSAISIAALIPLQVKAQVQANPYNRGPKKILHSEVMEHEPNPTYLPKYQGSNVKYIQGINKTGLTDGACYHLYYACMDPPQRVLDWYQNTLQANGFKITDSKRGVQRITAIKPDAGTSIMVNVQPFPMHDSKYMGFKTYYQVRYVERPPTVYKK